MPKTIVTPELASTLKLIRLQSGIQAKALAEHIGKSSAYISKLEKGEIKTVSEETIDKILEFLVTDEEERESLAERIYSLLEVKLTKKDIEEQIWFANFDTVYRELPVPPQLIDIFNQKLSSLNRSREYLLKRINGNEALSENEINDPNIEFNRWYSASNDGKVSSIKIKLDIDLVDDILEQRVSKAPYIVIFSIALYILKIEQYGDRVLLTQQENMLLMDNATAFLNSFKFYSLIEKNRILSRAQTSEETECLLDSFDSENLRIISSILSQLKIASEIDVTLTNERLQSFDDNLQSDCWFMLKLISLRFSSLKKLSVSTKKELLDEIETLIEKYASGDMRKIETY